MACPVCRSTKFYVKDPDDPFETTEFALDGGVPQFPGMDSEAPELTGQSEVFCEVCAWHGKLDEVK